MQVPLAKIRFDNSGSNPVQAEYQLDSDPPRPFVQGAPIPPGTSVEEVFPAPDGYAPVDILRVLVVGSDGQHVCKDTLEGPATTALAVRDDRWLDLILFRDPDYQVPLTEVTDCSPQPPPQETD